MHIGVSGKKYGLVKAAAKSVFHVDDDEPQDVNSMLRTQASKKKLEKQSQMEQEKVLAEDPTAYDYDGVYDKMQEVRQSSEPKKEPVRKSKYIEALMEKAKIREKEWSIAYDRKLHRELEAEKEMYAGKEKFVTSAYKQKLLDDQKYLEEERRKAAMEEDVTKKSDLRSFYSNLLTKNEAFSGGPRAMMNEPTPIAKDEPKKEEKDQKHDEDRDRHRDRNGDRYSDDRHHHRDDDRNRRDDKDRDRDRGDRDRDRNRDRDRDRDRSERSRDRYRDDDRRNERSRDTREDREKDRPDRKEGDGVRDGKRPHEASPQPNEDENAKKGQQKEGEKTDEKQAETVDPTKFAKKNDEASIAAARERYLKRKGLL
jgi:coiled-coil domain-containing protein 55